MSSTEAAARGPGHCIRQVAPSHPGSPATRPPPPSLIVTLGMMKPQLLEWLKDRAAAGPEAAGHLEDLRQAHGGFCLLNRIHAVHRTFWSGGGLCARWLTKALLTMAEGQTLGGF